MSGDKYEHALPLVGERSMSAALEKQGTIDARPPPGIGARHPVERIQLSHFRRGEEQGMLMSGKVHGMHAPLRMKMERETFAQFQRMPGLQSSMVGLECVLDMEDTIEFEDYLNMEEHAPMPRLVGGNRGVHEVMEARLNMKF